jgi:hypothetical protein
VNEPPPLAELIAQHGIEVPNPIPYTDATAGMVLWNEAHRLPALLDALQPVFERTTIVVQESSDATLQIALDRKRPRDVVLTDQWRGTGDASMPLLMRRISTPWAFVLAGDEMPDDMLLRSLWTASWWASQNQIDGIWVDFISTIEGVEAKEQVSHLRLFRTGLGWPSTMHSRPAAKKDGHWPHGRVVHARTLDEMIRDYLRYYQRGRGNRGWEAHNKMMMEHACRGVAAVRGWAFVRGFEWWPQVRLLCFGGKDPAVNL